MQEMARRIAKVSKEYKLPVVEDDYVSSFKVEMMDAVVQWCRGASFHDICKVRILFTGVIAHHADASQFANSLRTSSRGVSFECSAAYRSSSVK